jgi:two-component system chemotaxis response regulator CheB
LDTLKALVVDDTIVYRKIISDVLSEIPGVEVVGTAINGKIALSRLSSLTPDFVTLDIEMPEMNGIEVLKHMQKEHRDIVSVMLSTLTVKGGEMTIKALELGAFDFIPKPQEGTLTENKKIVKELLTPIVAAIRRQKEIRKRLKQGRLPSTAMPQVPLPKPTAKMPYIPPRRIAARAEIITIGISTGGPNALAKMMPMLPGDIGVPILIVQHMPPMFTKSLAASLNTKCSLTVREAENGDILQPNEVLIAPGGKQMKITAHANGRDRVVKITDDPPENSCKPSADYLFKSVASHYVGRATGVIMTGMGSDGSKGLKAMKKNGSFIIAQDEDSCTVYGMPKEPAESKTADIVVPLDRIASEIIKTVKK